MSKSGDNNPFRSGHTAALDLDDLEQEQLNEGWNPRQKSQWASDEWSGGKDKWHKDFGEGGGTAALDISALDVEDDEFSPKRDFDDPFGELTPVSGRRRDQRADFSNFSGQPSHTLSLDVEGLAPAPEPAPPFSNRRRRAERNEDHRDPHSHSDQRGRRSYEAGQGDPNARRSKATRDAGRNYTPGAAPDLDPEFETFTDDNQGLMPHERTQAVSREELERRGMGLRDEAQKASAPNEMPRTEALNMEEVRREIKRNAGELAPHERTQAFDLSGADGGLPQELLETNEELPATSLQSDSRSPRVVVDEGLTPILGRSGGSAKGPDNPNARTTVIDPRELNKLQENEADSGGKLLIFVPGADPVLFDLRPGVTNIGRERTNHLVLSDPFCSRRHMRLKKQGEAFLVRDNESDNGTLLNGESLSGLQDQALNHGDDITVGSTVMRFILGSPQPADYTPPTVQPASPRPAPPTGPQQSTQALQQGRPAPPTPHRAGQTGRRSSSLWLMLALGMILVIAVLLILIVALVYALGN